MAALTRQENRSPLDASAQLANLAGSHTPRFTALRVTLCCSPRPAAVELALIMRRHIKRASAQTVLAEFPTLSVTARRLTRGPKGMQSRELIFGCGY